MQSEISDAFSGARVRGKYDGKILADLKQRLENTPHNYAVVDIGRAMQGDHCIALGKAVMVLTLRRRQKLYERIDYHVADAEDLLGRNSLFLKIDVSVLARGKQQICELIGNQPVDFLRHGAVERAQSGFDVAHAHSSLGADQSRGDR
jgi:hypothetical protein